MDETLNHRKAISMSPLNKYYPLQIVTIITFSTLLGLLTKLNIFPYMCYES